VSAVAGAVLAGGLGRRMSPQAKAGALLAKRPLIAYPLAALAAVCDPVAVVAKASSELPPLGDAALWVEPDEPRHPLTGIVHALERADGPVLVCAADMPFVTAGACRALLDAVAAGAPAVVAQSQGDGEEPRLQPVFGLYLTDALDELRAALATEVALTATVEVLAPVRVTFPPEVLHGVNTPQELAAAERRLSA
jgi:molybdenum cofactor guanylyltransferase